MNFLLQPSTLTLRFFHLFFWCVSVSFDFGSFCCDRQINPSYILRFRSQMERRKLSQRKTICFTCNRFKRDDSPHVSWAWRGRRWGPCPGRRSARSQSSPPPTGPPPPCPAGTGSTAAPSPAPSSVCRSAPALCKLSVLIRNSSSVTVQIISAD